MTSDDSPRITIAIPTYNRCANVMDCVRSIQRQRLAAFECFVVDNGPSNDGTGQALAELCAEDGRFRHLPIGPDGCVVARNVGFTSGTAPILLTLDDDVELTDPETLDDVLEQFDSDPTLGVMGLSEYYAGGRGKGSAVARAAPLGWSSTWRDTGLYEPGKINRWGFIGTKLHHLSFGRLHDVDHVRSAAMAIRRTAFDHVGRFFEPYTAMGYGYRYETDLCVRIKASGYRVGFSAREPQVLHKVSERKRGWNRTDRDRNYLWFTNRNNTYFFLANYWRGWNAWIFLLWDLLVGSTTQPGVYRYLRFHRGTPRGQIVTGLAGKLEGWRMYRRHRRLPRERAPCGSPQHFGRT
jgi:glycosyltransferase involved in cell wall biosynthesis